MRSSTLLYAFAAASPALALTFGGWPLASCSTDCFNDILGEPALSKCKSTNVLCLCNEYAILGAMQDCLKRTNDCGSNQERTDTIFNIQAVCDAVIVAAAQPSSTGSAAPAKSTDNNPPPAGTAPAKPTSLEEAEKALGPSAYAAINKQPFHLSTGAKAGIAIGAIAGFLLLASIAFCCGVYHYKNHVIKKMNRDINMNSPPAPEYTAADTAAGSDKGTYSSWFSSSTAAGFIKSHTRGATNDTHELGYGFDKELGLMISSSAPSHPRNFASAPTKMQTVDTLPQALPKAVFPQRNPIVAPAVTRSLSIRSAYGAQKPSVTVTQSEAVNEDSSPITHKSASNIRVSVQSLRHQQANDSTSNIPLMFFTPATPQVNVSPVSPSASSISGNGDIFGYYTRDSSTPESTGGSIGVAKTSLDRGAATSPEPYDPINNDVYNRAPSPYTVSTSPASPYNDYSLSMESRMPIAGIDLSTEASSRGSTPSPTPRVGLHMPPRYTPYGSTDRSISPPLPPLPTASSPAPPPPSRTPEPNDRSVTPTTINRSNSNKWRLSVERAADKALDKVRSAATAITSTASNATGFAQVPEEEESKSELLNTTEDGRGRRKSKTTSTPRRADSGNPTPRSNSIGQSRSPSGRRTSNAANSAGGYRRSSSLGRYRNRTGSLSYNQIDGVNMPRGRSNRRGSNSSSVMLV
ncbi:hypothetical protein TWF696_000108 [Orbilia brochopaga]|uniref:CFEM domain-containing protein n=1 Tax=Orbilia brochopaga TaxID=3140254 RepID=A0AAV9VD48_9PEZI